MGNRTIFIVAGGILAAIIGVSYWKRQTIKRLAKKTLVKFSDIFSNPEKLESPDKKGTIAKMKPELAEKLLIVKGLWVKRGHKGKLKANSGFRTKEHNEEVGGVLNSAHVKGEAVDIAMSNPNRAVEFAIIASRAGFKRIGVANTFVHLDTSKTLPQTSWTYAGSKIKKENLKKLMQENYLKT